MPEPELWSAAQVAEHLGLSSAAAARRALSRGDIQAVGYQRNTGGRPEARYDAAAIRAMKRPGQGARTDLDGRRTDVSGEA